MHAVWYLGSQMRAYAATMPEPTSTWGKQIVTCHGDFHAGNLVRDEVSAVIPPPSMESASLALPTLG